MIRISVLLLSAFALLAQMPETNINGPGNPDAVTGNSALTTAGRGVFVSGAGAVTESSTLTSASIVAGASALTSVGNIPSISAAGILGLSKLSCALGTCTAYDDTATTGVTQLNLKAGAGQATLPSPLLNIWLNTAGTTPGLHMLADGKTGIGTVTPSTLLHARLSTANTSTVTDVATIGVDSTGTAAAGFGPRLLLSAETATASTYANFAAISGRIVTATAGAEDGALGLWTMKAGTLTQVWTSSHLGEITHLSTTARGNVPSCSKYTVVYTNSAFIDASAAASVSLFTLPARGKLTGVNIKHSTAFAGTGITSVTVSTGDGNTPYDQYASAFNVFQAVGDTAFQDSSQFKSTTMTSSTVSARFTANTNFGNGSSTVLTAGSVDIDACWVVLP